MMGQGLISDEKTSRERGLFYGSWMKRVGITIGDVNGIGVEVMLKALAYGRWSQETEFVLLGSEAVVRKQAEAMKIPLSRRLRFHDVGVATWRPGQLRVDASRLAVAAIEEGVKQAVTGQLDGLVTAPVNKLGFQRAGVDVPGHTELLAGLTGSSRYGMMLVGGGLRVMLATRHLPLKRFPQRLAKRSCERRLN